jgi:hypothetical protein
MYPTATSIPFPLSEPTPRQTPFPSSPYSLAHPPALAPSRSLRFVFRPQSQHGHGAACPRRRRVRAGRCGPDGPGRRRLRCRPPCAQGGECPRGPALWGGGRGSDCLAHPPPLLPVLPVHPFLHWFSFPFVPYFLHWFSFLSLPSFISAVQFPLAVPASHRALHLASPAPHRPPAHSPCPPAPLPPSAFPLRMRRSCSSWPLLTGRPAASSPSPPPPRRRPAARCDAEAAPLSSDSSLGGLAQSILCGQRVPCVVERRGYATGHTMMARNDDLQL